MDAAAAAAEAQRASAASLSEPPPPPPPDAAQLLAAAWRESEAGVITPPKPRQKGVAAAAAGGSSLGALGASLVSPRLGAAAKTSRPQPSPPKAAAAPPLCDVSAETLRSYRPLGASNGAFVGSGVMAETGSPLASRRTRLQSPAAASGFSFGPEAGAAAGAAAAPPPVRTVSDGPVQALVDPEALLAFVFPPGARHPPSAGRLVAYALHGPLGPGGRGLLGGQRRGRPLSNAELDAVVAAIEREDQLAAYAGALEVLGLEGCVTKPNPLTHLPSTDGSVLSNPDGILADVRAASQPLPSLPREAVVAMLADLPRDSVGRLSFHVVQARVLEARVRRVRDIQTPAALAVRAAEARADPLSRLASLRPPSPLGGRGKVAARLAADVAASGGHAGPVGAPGAAGVLLGGATGPVSFSRKMGDVERARTIERLLHRGSHLAANLEDLRKATLAPGIAASVTIFR